MSGRDRSIEELCRQRAHHLPGGRFCNPWAPHDHRRMLREFFRWQVTPNPQRREKRQNPGPPPSRPDFAALEALSGDYLVWLGHGTVYGRLGGVHLITDPLFWGILGRFSRRTACPALPGELPGLELILISHDHHDHLDLRSLRALLRRFPASQVVTGLGLAASLGRRGVRQAIELDWWQRRGLSSLEVRCLPVQHWSRRWVGDTDRTLWCGYSLRSGERALVFVGDSGYFRGFREMGASLGPFDVAILPIGAYRPRRLMAPQHMDPAEAYQAASDLRASQLLPTHWGTFGLGDEPLDAAPRELIEAAGERTAEGSPDLAVLNPGEVLSLIGIGRGGEAEVEGEGG